MALPAITKTWTFNVNNSLPATGTYLTDNQKLMLALKNYLKTVGWTVKGCCDSTVVGDYYDGTDRWVTYSNIVWAGAVSLPRSWIVLRAPAALSPSLEIMISCLTNAGGGTDRCLWAVISGSWTGFSGGNTTTNPSAATSVAFVPLGYSASSQWKGVSGSLSSFSCVWHGMTATDGTTRLIICSNNTVMFHWSFERLIGSAVADPSLAFMANGTYYASAYTHWNDKAVFHNYSTATDGAFYLTAEAYGAAMVGQNITAANDRGGGYWMGAIGIASTTGGFRGRQGILGDLWWGTSGVGYGSTIPDDGTKQFVQFSDMIFPWNGTTPLIA